MVEAARNEAHAMLAKDITLKKYPIIRATLDLRGQSHHE
jgi:hypothetical protein